MGRDSVEPVKEKVRLPLLTKVVLLTLFFPAYFSIGSLALSPSKLVFLFLVPALLVNLLRGRYGRLLFVDIFFLIFAAWMTLAMLANHTPQVAIEYTGSSTVTLLGGYLTARATIRTKAQFIALVRFLTLVVIISLPFALYETATSRTTIPRWIAELPGFRSHNDINHDPRFGLWRVQFVFAHPIHYGIFCCMVFSLVFVGLVRVIGTPLRLVTSGAVALCCFLSVSSGPFLALLTQFALIFWAWSMRWTGMPWRLIGWIGVISYIILEVASNRPAIYAIVSRLAFNSSTAFSRRVLFEHGVAQIGRNPILGIGYNDWPLPAWMTGSIDNFWLFLAIIFGLPGLGFFAGAFVGALILVGLQKFDGDPVLASLRRAWIFTMVSLGICLGTVAIWGELYSLVLFMLGSGLWMASASQNPPAVRSQQSSRYTPSAPRLPVRH